MKRAFCLLLSAVLLLAGCARTEQKPAPELLEPVGVKTDSASVVRGDLCTLTVCEGSIVADAEELCFDIDGTVSAVRAYPGQLVREGDILFELDQTGLEKQIDGLSSRIDYIQTNAIFDDELAEIDMAVMEAELNALRAAGDEKQIALKQLDIEQARLSLRQTQELRALTLSELRRELEVLRSGEGKNLITAPFSGHVFYESLEEGDRAQAGKAVAWIASDTDYTLVVSSYLSESRLASGAFYALIGDGRYALELIPMSREEMTAVALSGKALTTRFRVLGDDLSGVSAGMYAVVCCEGERRENVLQIPSGAVYSSGGARYVYVTDGEGSRERRDVKTGLSNGVMTEITEGLEEGETVYVKE